MEDAFQNRITGAVAALLTARTWEESKHIVESRHDSLLTDAADRFLGSLLEQANEDAVLTRLLRERRELLMRCRQVGIRAAFADAMHAELRRLFSQTKQSPNRQIMVQLQAALQNALASSLFQDPKGEQEENLEQVITNYRQALEVYTRDAFPQDWAATQYNLANAYHERVRGERAENLEEAIARFQQALEVYTQDAFPQDWAATQNDIAIVYEDRVRGERAENLEEAISRFQQALEVYTRDTFAQDWARAQNNLAIAYDNRIHGERADNLEQVISHCQHALEVYTRDAFPQNWAMTQNNLAVAYWSRIRGERADNLEQAISHYEQALEVHTRQAFPQDWARAQNNLAIAYTNRIRGERADNLEQAISRCQHALEVHTRHDLPQYWAATQTNMAAIYNDRIRGERADNVDLAISHYQQALEVRTRHAFPEDWAMTQNNLANAYQERVRGERADNLEQAIFHYQQALEVRTRHAFPQYWATTQHNMASAYQERLRGERADNVEQAISRFHLALEVRTRHAFPEDWAATQNNLANAYQARVRGTRADSLEQAISHYQQALEVRTRHAFPQDWAMTQHNLARAYQRRIRGERSDNLEQTISHFQQALEVRTRNAFPQNWANTVYNLATAYQERICGKRADNLKHAISHYQQALEVYTPLTFPQNCRDGAYGLGQLLYDERRFPEARQALETAHEAVGALRGEVQRDIAKRSIAAENAELYARLVFCCVADKDEEAAFKYAVAGKGRAFVDLLTTARIDLVSESVHDPALASDLLKAVNLRQQIDNLTAALTGELSLARAESTSDEPSLGHATWSPELLSVQLNALRKEGSRHWEEMAYKYPALTATQQAPLLSADYAHMLASELRAILVEYYRHAEGWCAFIVEPNAIYYVSLPLVNDELLKRMATWVKRLDHPEGRNQISLSQLFDWHDAVIAPLEESFPQGQPIVLAPFGMLHVLPLTAACNRKSKRYVGEDYQVSFAPSLSALRAVWEQARRTGGNRQGAPDRLLNVAYPSATTSNHYLPSVLIEAHNIAGHFAQITPLYENAATADAVLRHSHNQHVVHFGCHGWFDAHLPEQSGLLLAGGWLTVQRMITELHLDQARIATLGACLSGREALQQGDEHVGLLQAMLTSGVLAVVASLWSVDDAATRALFEMFYSYLVAGDSPAKAVQKATEHVRSHPEHTEWKHPYFWAAFQVTGLAHGIAATEESHPI